MTYGKHSQGPDPANMKLNGRRLGPSAWPGHNKESVSSVQMGLFSDSAIVEFFLCLKGYNILGSPPAR